MPIGTITIGATTAAANGLTTLRYTANTANVTLSTAGWVMWDQDSTSTSGPLGVGSYWQTMPVLTNTLTASGLVHWRPLTPEQAAQRAEAERQRQQAEAERRREQRAADVRAERLLRRCLTQEQRRCLRQRGHFVVQSELGGTYRINRGAVRNVERLDAKGRAVTQFCIHPQEAVPDADTMLAQLLLLRTDERRFVRVAHKTALRPRRRRGQQQGNVVAVMTEGYLLNAVRYAAERADFDGVGTTGAGGARP